MGEEYLSRIQNSEGIEGGDENQLNRNLKNKITYIGEETIGRTRRRVNNQGRSWWNNYIDAARRERKNINRERRSLKNRLNRGEDTRNRLQQVEEEYEFKKNQVKKLIQEAMTKDEKHKLNIAIE